MSFRISECWMFAAVDPADDEEGLATIFTSDGTVLPMVATDTQRRDWLRELARAYATEHNLVVRELHLTGMEVVQEIHPRPSFTCPRCQRRSLHPQDLTHSYCAHCHEHFPAGAGG